MGYDRHHAIVVTSFLPDRVAMAHAKATELGMTVTNITAEDAFNGYSSFLVAPDGSKEGWAESSRGDARREEFTDWLAAQREDDDSSTIDWVEVQFGDDDRETKVIRDSDEHYRARWADNRSLPVAAPDPDKERGMYPKYAVFRLNADDPAHLFQIFDPFFVLRYTSDPHARAAVLAYADSCEAEFPVLAADLRRAASQCGHDGGTGIGAGHECHCVREVGHPLDDDRPHGCSCGALWGDQR